MSKNMKKQEKLQSKGEQDDSLSKGAQTERERSSNRPGTGRYSGEETIKPASASEVSPNTPSGEDV